MKPLNYGLIITLLLTLISGVAYVTRLDYKVNAALAGQDKLQGQVDKLMYFNVLLRSAKPVKGE
jgi:F0F1-type ATP synthase assembly protein I